MIRFIGPLHRNAQIIGLLLGQLGQFDTQPAEMESGDFFIKFFRQSVHLDFVLFRGKCNLGQNLVCETVAHHKTGMAGGTTKVYQAAFGKNNDGSA